MIKRIIPILLFVLLTLSAHAQVVQHMPMSEVRRLHFGFVLGLNQADVQITNNAIRQPDGEIWFADETSYSTGFTVGVISELKLFENLFLRLVPTLNFCDRHISMISEGGAPSSMSPVVIRSSLLDVPLLLKYRAKRIGNYRPYLIAGGGVVYDFSRKKQDIFRLQPFDANIQFGIGCDFFLPYFRFAPELKLVVGMTDMLERDRPDIDRPSDIKYTNAIDRLTSRLFVLSFNFE
ncbi:MAG: PorT family protein [Prevotellaceae bacterium]|jgi:hypothetical protein|nr:PorT family protein [Prevotellaceae bacterium]